MKPNCHNGETKLKALITMTTIMWNEPLMVNLWSNSAHCFGFPACNSTVLVHSLIAFVSSSSRHVYSAKKLKNRLCNLPGTKQQPKLLNIVEIWIDCSKSNVFIHQLLSLKSLTDMIYYSRMNYLLHLKVYWNTFWDQHVLVDVIFKAAVCSKTFIYQ